MSTASALGLSPYAHVPHTAVAHRAWMLEAELSRPVLDLTAPVPAPEAWVLIRIFGQPLGIVVLPVIDGRVTASDVTAQVIEHLEGAVREALQDDDEATESVLSGRGCSSRPTTAFLADEARAIAQGPRITVVLCTRNRPDDVVAVLDSLAAQTYPHREVLVVDNAPGDNLTRDVVLARPPEERVHYVVEPTPGLSWARNRALAEVTTDIVAWIDDDEVADAHWLAQLAVAFTDDPDLACAGGSVVPWELRSDAQYHFERFGGHTKGRGFVPDMFAAGTPGGQDPLYPVPPFAVGANMAFATPWLHRIGGFDPALGAGTLTQGGEDTLAFARVLLLGGRIAYRPQALTRHRHRADDEGLRRQMYGYGVGLTAFYTALLCRHPAQALRAVRLLPTALRHIRGAQADPALAPPKDFPAELLALKRRAMLRGPSAYLQARVRARTLRRAARS